MSMGSSFAKINREPSSFASINNWNWAPSLSSNRSSRVLNHKRPCKRILTTNRRLARRAGRSHAFEGSPDPLQRSTIHLV